MKLFDAHCHLQDERLAPVLDEALRAARAAGVAGFACCGSSETDWERVAALADAHADVFPSFGLYPWYVGERTGGWMKALEERLKDRPGAGVGEIGLDHAIDGGTWVDQQDVFMAQLRLARELKRPVSIHCRRAWGAMIPALREAGPLPAGFVVHSFSGAKEQVEQIVALGGYISFSGSVTLSGNRRAHRNVPLVPADRILIETDAPDIPPVIGGKRDAGSVNVPENLLHVLRKVAELRAVPEEDLASETRRNCERLFAL